MRKGWDKVVNEMTLEQLEKAQKLAELIATVSKSAGYLDIALAKQVFNLANGINEDSEDRGLIVRDKNGDVVMTLTDDEYFFKGCCKIKEKMY